MLKTLRLLWSRPLDWEAHEIPPWRRVRYLDGSRSERGAVVMHRYFKSWEYRQPAEGELAGIDRHAAEQQTGSF
jgi:hypothetical protein